MSTNDTATFLAGDRYRPVRMSDGSKIAVNSGADAPDACAAVILDGDVRGQRTHAALCALAQYYGWTAVGGRTYTGEEEFDDHVESDSNDALAHLNGQIAEDADHGYRFGWYEGSVFLANQAWWEMG